MITILIIVSVLCLFIISHILSAFETAFTALDLSKIVSSNIDNKKSSLIKKLHNEKGHVISTILLINSLVNIVISAIITKIFITYFDEMGILYSAIFTTVTIFIFAESLPKTYAIRMPEVVSIKFVQQINIVYKLFFPFVNFFQQKVVHFFINIFFSEKENEKSNTADLLKNVISFYKENQKSTNVRNNLKFIDAVLCLSTVVTSDIMICKEELVFLPKTTCLKEILEHFYTIPVEKIFIYDNTKEDIIGFIRRATTFEVLKDNSNLNIKFSIDKILERVLFTLEDTPLDLQLSYFITEKCNCMIARDVSGIIKGYISINDLLNEIFANLEISNLNNKKLSTERKIVKVSDRKFRINASLSIREMDKYFNIKLPCRSSTISGFILKHAGCVPNIGEYFAFKDIIFKIIDKERKSIRWVEIELMTNEEFL